MDVERRSVLKGLAAAVTGAVASAASSEAESHAAVAGPQTQPSAPAPTLSASTGLLDAHQRATLASLAELIVPGSVAAGAVDRIDRLAAVDAPAAQRRLLNAIARFDQEARNASAGRWLDLSDTARLEILTHAADGEPGQTPQPPWTPGQPLPTPAPVTPPAATTLRDHLDVLKVSIGAAYATTEAGMRALGWTGRSSWPELPDCQDTGAPVD